MNKNIKIRAATSEDIDEIIRIEKSSFTCPWPGSFFIKELNNKNCHFFVLLNQGILCGYIIAWHILDTFEIQNIAIKKEYRQSGFAGLLLEKIKKTALKNRAGYLFLEVRESNFKAINLYEKNNFKKTGARKNYYQNNETAILMEKDLTHLKDKKISNKEESNQL